MFVIEGQTYTQKAPLSLLMEQSAGPHRAMPTALSRQLHEYQATNVQNLPTMAVPWRLWL